MRRTLFGGLTSLLLWGAFGCSSSGNDAATPQRAGNHITAGSTSTVRLSVAIGYSNMQRAADPKFCQPVALPLPDGSKVTRSHRSLVPTTAVNDCTWPRILDGCLNAGRSGSEIEIIVDAAASSGNTNVWYTSGDRTNPYYRSMLSLYRESKQRLEALGARVVPGCAYLDLTFYLGPNAHPIFEPRNLAGLQAIRYNAEIATELLDWVRADLGISCFRLAQHTFGGLGAAGCAYGDPNCVSTKTRNESFVIEELLMRQSAGRLSGIEWPVNNNSFTHALWPDGFASDGGHLLADAVQQVGNNYCRVMLGAPPHPPAVSIVTGPVGRTMTFAVNLTNSAGSIDYVDWYFGADEMRAIGPRVFHTFAASGSHQVEVFVHMDHAGGGEIGRASAKIQVP